MLNHFSCYIYGFPVAQIYRIRFLAGTAGSPRCDAQDAKIFLDGYAPVTAIQQEALLLEST